MLSIRLKAAVDAEHAIKFLKLMLSVRLRSLLFLKLILSTYRQAGCSFDGGQPLLYQTWVSHSTLGSTLRWSLQSVGQAGQNFQAGDWWPPGDRQRGPPKASPWAGSCGVGRQTVVQIMTPQYE